VHDLLGHRQPDPGPVFFVVKKGRRSGPGSPGDSGAVVTNVDPEELSSFPTGREVHCDMPVQANRLGKVAGRLEETVTVPFPGRHPLRWPGCSSAPARAGRHPHPPTGAIWRFLDGKLHLRVEVDHSRHDAVDESIHPIGWIPARGRTKFRHSRMMYSTFSTSRTSWRRGKEFLVSGQMRFKEAGVDADAGDRVAISCASRRICRDQEPLLQFSLSSSSPRGSGP